MVDNGNNDTGDPYFIAFSSLKYLKSRFRISTLLKHTKNKLRVLHLHTVFDLNNLLVQTDNNVSIIQEINL